MSQPVTTLNHQYLIKRAVSWEQYKALQSAFIDIPGVNLTYCEGVLEIMGISLEHEKIASLICILLSQYFLVKKIKFTATGSFSQIVEFKTEFQADVSFSFSNQEDRSDLCIEVIITSGSPVKLRKYQLRSVPEVWFWENGKISIFILQNDSYIQVKNSSFLPDLDILHLESCLLMESQLEAMLMFQNKYNQLSSS